jgi:hypothetical protein
MTDGIYSMQVEFVLARLTTKLLAGHPCESGDLVRKVHQLPKSQKATVHIIYTIMLLDAQYLLSENVKDQSTISIDN